MARTILIGAGGTGGHIFPGIAVADELVRRDAATRVVFAGTPRGLETRLVPKAGYALELLPILPLNGVGLLRTLGGLLALPWGLLKSALVVSLGSGWPYRADSSCSGWRGSAPAAGERRLRAVQPQGERACLEAARAQHERIYGARFEHDRFYLGPRAAKRKSRRTILQRRQTMRPF